MSKEKTIQLTNRNPKAKWKSKNRETGATEFVLMSDMSDHHLQGALVLCQKRKLLNFMIFLKDSELEKQLKQAAKDRNLVLEDLDHLKVTRLGAQFTEFEEVMIFAFQSITRKQKQLDKV